MFRRLLWAILFLLIAVLAGLLPSGYKVIECNNQDKVCKTYNVNSILKTKTLKNSVKVDSLSGTSWHVLGVGKDNRKNLECYKKFYKIYNRSTQKTRDRIKYLLVPINVLHPEKKNLEREKHNTINEYGSSASCEVDRINIQTYLSSNSTEPFVYTTGGSYFRYLWYLLSALFVYLAYVVLFKAQILTEQESKELEKAISEEDAERVHNAARKVVKTIGEFDNLGADIVKQSERKFDSFKIDVRNKED